MPQDPRETERTTRYSRQAAQHPGRLLVHLQALRERPNESTIVRSSIFESVQRRALSLLGGFAPELSARISERSS